MTRYFRDYPARTGDRTLFKMEHYLEVYDALLAENDQDLMAWTLGQSAPPAGLAPLLARITAFAETRLKAGI